MYTRKHQLQLLVQRLLESVKRLKLGSDSKHPLPFERCPASNPEQMSIIVLCQNVRCKIGGYTMNLILR